MLFHAVTPFLDFASTEVESVLQVLKALGVPEARSKRCSTHEAKGRCQRYFDATHDLALLTTRELPTGTECVTSCFYALNSR